MNIIKFSAVGTVVMLLIWLIAWGTIAFIAIHFLRKVW
jgi:hypothetical protein